jgi:hypothetical protein
VVGHDVKLADFEGQFLADDVLLEIEDHIDGGITHIQEGDVEFLGREVVDLEREELCVTENGTSL